VERAPRREGADRGWGVSETYNEVAERMQRLMGGHTALVEGDRTERVEAYMAAIMADSDRHPDDYRLCVHTEFTERGYTTHHWLEHKSVERPFALLPPEV